MGHYQFSDYEIGQIKQTYLFGFGYKHLANLFGVSPGAIRDIIKRRSYNRIKHEIDELVAMEVQKRAEKQLGKK